MALLALLALLALRSEFPGNSAEDLAAELLNFLDTGVGHPLNLRFEVSARRGSFYVALTRAGPIGRTGASGPTGPIGAIGPTGAIGPIGSDGGGAADGRLGCCSEVFNADGLELVHERVVHHDALLVECPDRCQPAKHDQSTTPGQLAHAYSQQRSPSRGP